MESCSYLYMCVCVCAGEHLIVSYYCDPVCSLSSVICHAVMDGLLVWVS